jgi:decaprenylphospho-beta-D-erythro-pentofuranosid-2-ulose 2-reductase
MSKNKSILIIGAKSDIALSVAKKYASEGYNLQLAARNSSELGVAAKDLRIRYEINVSIYEIDILKYETFGYFIDSLDCLPDIALCAVGILGNQKNIKNNFSDLILILRTNYEGPSLLLGEIAHRFEERGHGSIIGISSVAGDRGRASNFIYGSSKAGFTGFLSGLRNCMYKEGVHVMTVVPGFVATKMTRNMELPSFLTSSSSKAANMIYKGELKKKNIIYISSRWKIVMFIIKIIPERIFKKLNL